MGQQGGWGAGGWVALSEGVRACCVVGLEFEICRVGWGVMGLTLGVKGFV